MQNLCRSRNTLQTECILATIGPDTAENEPSEARSHGGSAEWQGLTGRRKVPGGYVAAELSNQVHCHEGGDNCVKKEVETLVI